MEVKKAENYFELILDNNLFLLDPLRIPKNDCPIILTDFERKTNKNKIFNSPGEYSVFDVYFWGVENKNSIVYIFESQEGNLLYSSFPLQEECLKKIRLIKKEFDCLFFINFFQEDLINLFKPKVVLSDKSIKIVKFENQKGDKIKINLKKVNNLIFTFV